jgi:hypothetical protein
LQSELVTRRTDGVDRGVDEALFEEEFVRGGDDCALRRQGAFGAEAAVVAAGLDGLDHIRDSQTITDSSTLRK